MNDLRDAAAAVLAVMGRVPLAWARRDECEAEVGAGTLAELEAAGWVEPWHRYDGPAVSLTPWGADRLAVHIEEYQRAGFVTEYRWCPLRKAEIRHVVAGQAPYFAEHDPAAEPVALARRRVRHHKRPGEVELLYPDKIVSPYRSTQEWWRDQDGEEVLIFGRKVPIDRRIKPGRAG